MKEFVIGAALVAVGVVIFWLATIFTQKEVRDLTESIRRLRLSVESFTNFKADAFTGMVLPDGSLEVTFIKDLGPSLDGREDERRSQCVRVFLPRDMWQAISHPDGPRLVLGIQKELKPEDENGSTR